MEPSGRNRWQMGRTRRPLKQADPQPVETQGNRFGDGKEGSTVRVRQRALQKPRTSALSRSPLPAEGGRDVFGFAVVVGDCRTVQTV
jgi:hypothetical protein